MSDPFSERLVDLIGAEHQSHKLGGALREHVSALRAPAVGAFQICCSDESEEETQAAFHQEFVRHLLPPLKDFSRSAFRTINLGGRYERGSMAIAENHYAIPASDSHFKVVVVKINSHVGVSGPPTAQVYGTMNRYKRDSHSCGALHAMLGGADVPAASELAATFGSERLAALKDSPPGDVALRMALANTVLQTQRACADIVSRRPDSPTVYLVASCVTVNRVNQDTEILAGLTHFDTRTSDPTPMFRGLDTDPAAYRFEYQGPLVTVRED